MINNTAQPTIKEDEVKKIDFFHDFIVFLKYLEKQPIQKTLKGNISLSDIEKLGEIFRQRKAWDEHKEFGWKITSERNIEVLTQIKILAQVMRLTYDRKNKLLLSKSGKDFLYKLTFEEQLTAIVLTFWQKVNWDYFSAGREILGMSVTEILQENQLTIWEMLLNKGSGWSDYSVFCENIKKQLDLSPFYEDADDYQWSLFMDIEYGLIYRNLARFGCIETEEKLVNGLEQISRFRPTEVGRYLFKRSLDQDLQSFFAYLMKENRIIGNG
ncbi:MAG: hypothetical protein M1150_04460 [Patescibacteria group bacterium]|nr:hypothetical protein [Patescibacteria group bacterium]